MPDDNSTEPVVDVDVVVPPTEPDPAPAPVVVVADTGGDGGNAVDAVVLDHTIDNAAEIAELKRVNAELAALVAANIEQTTHVAETAAVAVEVAGAAHDEAVEANTEPQAGADDDKVPNHEHPWFRTHGRRD